jgi:cytochrome P450
VSRLPYIWSLYQGRLHQSIKEIHDRYGPIVRIAPDELSFTINEAWGTIYTGGNGNKGFPKHEATRDAQSFESLFDAPDDSHSRIRKVLMKDFFSSRAARNQESSVQEFTDRMIAQLKTHHCLSKDDEQMVTKEPSSGIARPPPAEMCAWYNWATFDIVGHIALSEDFGCLAGLSYHPWLLMVMTHLRVSNVAMCLRYYPLLPALLSYLAPKKLLQMQHDFLSLVRESVGRRRHRTLPPDERDFVAVALREGDLGADSSIKPLSEAEIEANCTLMLIAGSETLATTLLAATHMLCENPVAMRRLTDEVRSAAPSESDVSFENTTTNMPYLNAVLRETHRLFPPLVNGPARVIGSTPVTIGGRVIPPGTAVGVTQFAANRSASNFSRPEDFVPERWLSPEYAAKFAAKGDGWDHEEFANDKRDVVRPFSAGGRDCLGQNLSWVEMRVMLARMVWNFDMEAHRSKHEYIVNGQDKSHEFKSFSKWTDQKAYMLWQKEEYHVWLRTRSQDN